MLSSMVDISALGKLLASLVAGTVTLALDSDEDVEGGGDAAVEDKSEDGWGGSIALALLSVVESGEAFSRNELELE